MTVRPLKEEPPVVVLPPVDEPRTSATPPKRRSPKPVQAAPPPLKPPPLKLAPPATIDQNGLDASWERKLAKALVQPDFTLDLHGHSLDAAHRRLDMGLAQAAAMGARVVLVITGRPRPAEAADRGSNRGAIRAKVLDWLALGSHGSNIAAVRGAHRRHGGAGALYVVLRRPR
jgi:DNA-nicking Smr family endonuclease